ncbi:epidermal growth factor receptor substrate 15 homolog isoform X4 [Anopheles cruzii]|uniref:epidermal growth factor receptor substrate 15 homolog isoform X4 n=1 Tax=Anopheles cruzii TaxID=68878 RepID=UPI0022EC6C5C|nr:epidermal growth factor receptor substrate 15 homolog isoform X4 [Anopheles cruzii]
MSADESDRIPSTTLAVLRGILVKSLSRENLTLTDQQQLLGGRRDRHVQFSLAGNRDASAQKQSRPSSANRELQKEREERIKQMKERQNEDRQKKLEELKAQALAAQKFREQKEEERRRRMDDLRRRENDRRSQVEERRRAIIEADNERREYILRKNQERDQRMETKRRNDRGSIQFAFGSSTPRMIDTSDSGMCSSFWAHRRATSITNVAYTGAALTRRSSERELTDGAAKKRATSASGLDRSTDDTRRMSSSMYEVFNWTSTSESCPRKLTFSLAAGPGINIDEPPTAAEYQPAITRSSYASGKDDTAEMNYQRTVNRRKTDLMPTIPSPRDSSRSSLGTHTPRTPGRAFSMTRLDQLATPRRRNGEHISAIAERERRQALELDNLTRLSLSSSRSSPTGTASKRMSRSMSQLAGGGGGGSGGAKYRNQSQDSSSGRSYGGGGGRKSLFNSSIHSGSSSPMRRTDTSKSMSQLNAATNLSVGSGPRSTTKTERLRHQHHQQQQQQSPSNQQQQLTNGLRSGEMTPTSLNTSRPGSALSSSTIASGVVYRRSMPAQRKARPASIAVTGVTASGLKEEKPPLPKTGSGVSAAGFTHGGSKLRLSSAGSGSINTTPVKSASGTETPTRKPLSLHSAEKRAARGAITSRVPSTASASTPLQSPGPEKAARNLQDSLKKSAEVSKKLSSVSDDKPVPKQPAKQEQELPVEVKVEEKQQEPVVLLEELPVTVPVQPETVPQEPLLVFEQPAGPNSEQQPLVQLEWQQQLPEEVSTVVQPETILIVTEDVVTPTASVAIDELEVSPVKQQEPDGRDTAPETLVAPVAEVQESNLVAVDAGAGGDAMTASMIAKRITTEGEAKAALAERRRLAREEAERQAELERQRIEAEEQAERQRVLDEEERLRKLEEETIRLAEEQRRTEDERLQQAIEEARRRDEEDRKRREEEARQKVEREEAERKAREEAERQRLEMVERLKKEEKEREERRKRVEAIMSRTRAKGTANNTPTKNNEDDKENSMSKSQIVLSSTPAALPTGTAMSASTISMTDSFIASEIRQEQEQQHLQQQNSQESLEKTMESLSLSNNNINATHSSSNSSSNSSSSETIANNNNNNNNGGNNSIEFERTVTDKENMLLASGGGGIPAANNNLNNGTSGGASNGTSGPTSTDCALNDAPMVMTTANGKADPATSNGSHGSSTNSTSDLIIEDALMGQTNGHKNGTIDNVFEEHVADAMPLRSATVPLEIADFLSPKRQSYDLCAAAAAAGTFDPFSPFDDGSYGQDADLQQHSSFDSSATSSTGTTDTTTVTTTGTGAVASYDQLIDFASLPAADDDDIGSTTNDSNFNPLAAPFGGAPEAPGSSDTQHHPFDYHNLSNNNSINLFDTTSYDDGSSATTTNTTTTRFNNNNNASIANPRLVSATSDGQEHRDLSLL